MLLSDTQDPETLGVYAGQQIAVTGQLNATAGAAGEPPSITADSIAPLSARPAVPLSVNGGCACWLAALSSNNKRCRRGFNTAMECSILKGRVYVHLRWVWSRQAVWLSSRCGAFLSFGHCRRRLLFLFSEVEDPLVRVEDASQSSLTLPVSQFDPLLRSLRCGGWTTVPCLLFWKVALLKPLHQGHCAAAHSTWAGKALGWLAGVILQAASHPTQAVDSNSASPLC